MVRTVLEQLVRELSTESLPPNWQGLDLATFSPDKQLYDYQQTALRNALLALWKYYQPANGRFEPSESARLKEQFWAWYRVFDPSVAQVIRPDGRSGINRKVQRILEEYYPLDGNTLDFVHLVNRMSFWMATGSGKTLVLVKLVELLCNLMQRAEIPVCDILILTHRDDLLHQMRAHVEDYNRLWGSAPGHPYLHLRDLKEYAEAKRGMRLFGDREATVFVYRSDNLSDVQKERIVDFRNYENGGRWYVLLDEAHKGDKEESKRQFIYSILARNGFLFNFSATFIEPADVVTTVANFNLSEFIRSGYGKRITVLRQEVRQFHPSEDYSDDEKHKIVLKALLLLGYIRAHEEQVRTVQRDLYHRPLLMTLVNTVNTEDADLKLFFRELVRLAGGQVDDIVLETAKAELLDELAGAARYLFEDTPVLVDADRLRTLTRDALFRYVFNAESAGEIEVLVRPSNRQEIAFKIKTAAEPFALVRIGDVSDWLKSELHGYSINERFSDESHFERLNRPDSSINILLGSRTFYEGWDSNRPNVVMYINIGTGTEARKFVLQSVGRGVRIEPLPGQRKRLRHLRAAGIPGVCQVFEQVQKAVDPLESLFIFGTNRQALETVINEMRQADVTGGGHELTLLRRNDPAIAGNPLLIPVYRRSEQPLYPRKAKFAITNDDLTRLQRYVDYVDDDRVLMALHNAAPWQVRVLREAVGHVHNFFRLDGRPFKRVDVLMRQFLSYLDARGQEVDKLKLMEDEICHYRHIRVSLQDIGELEKSIQRVLESPKRIAEAKAKYRAEQLSLDDLLAITRANPDTGIFQPSGKAKLEIRLIAQHYYLPVLLSDDERIDYIRHIIRHPSEVHFLSELEEYLKESNNLFQEYCEWWLFSRIDENLDAVYIPYYDPSENRMREFKPDFVFWMKKGNAYRILFVDPKGAAHTIYQYKADGFAHLFEDNGAPRTFAYDGLSVQVHLAFHTRDANLVSQQYRRFWIDSPERLVTKAWP